MRKLDFVRYPIAACAMLLSASASTLALDRPQDYHRALTAACGKEIKSQCRGIHDARGQLLACLYAHQVNLSPRCEGLVWGAMQSLGKTLGKVERVRIGCDRDEHQYCKDVEAGGGNLVSCFLSADKVISPQCKAAIYSIWDKNGSGVTARNGVEASRGPKVFVPPTRHLGVPEV